MKKLLLFLFLIPALAYGDMSAPDQRGHAGQVCLANKSNIFTKNQTFLGTANALGTISSGTWNGSVIGSSYGGAGSISGALKGNGSGTVSQAACADLSNAAASCSTDATNASNIGSGTLASARGGAGTITGALKGSGAGVVSQAACSDLSNGATGCSTTVGTSATVNTGTSGATIPLLNGTNTWSGAQSFNSSDLVLKGATSGTTTLNAAATAGTTTITLPGGTTDFSATGGTSQVVKQTSSGGAFTVARLACSDLSNSASSCATDATNASNIGSGTLAAARGGAGTVNGALKGDGAGSVSQANCASLSDGTTNCSAAVGQLPGTTTNDSASSGKVGEYLSSYSDNGTATVTMTIASPAVITWTTHGYTNANNNCAPVVFTTTGALPTGITSGTTYWMIGSTFTANTFQVATTIANCFAGTAVNTSGSQSGTHTAIDHVAVTNGNTFDIGAIQLTAGDWDVWGQSQTNVAGSTNMTLLIASISTTSNTLGVPPNGGAYAILQLAGGSSTIGGNFGLPTGMKRISVSSTTTVYVNGLSNFTVSTNALFGGIFARRVR